MLKRLKKATKLKKEKLKKEKLQKKLHLCIYKNSCMYASLFVCGFAYKG